MAGVLGVVPGQIGLIQAAEAIKLILTKGRPLIGHFLLYHSLEADFQLIDVKKNPFCPLCSDQPKIKGLVDYDDACAPNAVSVSAA